MQCWYATRRLSWGEEPETQMFSSSVYLPTAQSTKKTLITHSLFSAVAWVIKYSTRWSTRTIKCSIRTALPVTRASDRRTGLYTAALWVTVYFVVYQLSIDGGALCSVSGEVNRCHIVNSLSPSCRPANRANNVRLSVCLSRAGTVSSWMNPARPSFWHRCYHQLILHCSCRIILESPQ